MNTSIQQQNPYASLACKILSALALAALVGGLALLPTAASAADRGNDHGNGRGHDDHGPRESRDHHHDDYGRRFDHGGAYHYAQPVYVPPPVYYEPQQSPGISLFLPLDIRR